MRLTSPSHRWLPKPSSSHVHIVEYAADFTVPIDFGNPGAVIVTNLHDKEFYVLEIVVHGFIEGPIFFPASTWIHSQKDNVGSIIIFSNQAYHHHKHHQASRIYDVKTYSAFAITEKGREKHMKEFTIMLLITIWATLIKTMILLGRSLVVKNGPIPDAVELADLQRSQIHSLRIVSKSHIQFICLVMKLSRRSSRTLSQQEGVMLRHEDQKEVIRNTFPGSVMDKALSIGERLLKYEVPAVIKHKYIQLEEVLKKRKTKSR